MSKLIVPEAVGPYCRNSRKGSTAQLVTRLWMSNGMDKTSRNSQYALGSRTRKPGRRAIIPPNAKASSTNPKRFRPSTVTMATKTPIATMPVPAINGRVGLSLCAVIATTLYQPITMQELAVRGERLLGFRRGFGCAALGALKATEQIYHPRPVIEASCQIGHPV